MMVEGSEAAFVVLYRCHYGAVYAYARRRAPADLIDDVVAETFLVALRRPAAVPDVDPLPWLYGVARRVMANQRRGQRREQGLDEHLQRLRTTSIELDPADAVTQGIAVSQALAQLSDRDQEVLRLVGWEELSVASAATAADCSTTAMAVRLHRARRRLARLLEESGAYAGPHRQAGPVPALPPAPLREVN